MNRDAFIDFLARAVADGLLGEEAAAELVREYDAGTLGDGWDLPLPPEEAVRGLDRAAIAGAVLGLLAFLSRQRVRTRELAPAQVTLRGVLTLDFGGPPVSILRNLGNADRLITGLQASYEAQARGLATQLATGRITVAEWQLGMEGAIQSHVIQQMGIGGGSTALDARQWGEVDRIMREQQAYLSRFADTIAARQGVGSPLSEAYIANRAESYGGVGRGLGYGEMETAMLTDGTLNGYLVRYRSRDDSATCTPCLAADRNGPYLPGTPHPLPGQICLGRNRCRCTLEYYYDLAAWQRLTGN